MPESNGSTHDAVLTATAEIRHVVERLERVDKRLEALQAELRAVHEDLSDLKPRCAVHSEQIGQLQTALGQRTAGGVVGLIAALGAAVKLWLDGGGNRP